MPNFTLSQKPLYSRMLCAILLSCTFISGVLSGVVVVCNKPDQYISLAQNCANISVSYIGLLCHVLMPFCLTAILSNAKRTEFFFILCFFQAFTYGIVSASIYFAYPLAHWLITWILLFTSTFTLMASLWYWFCALSDPLCKIQPKLLIYLAISLSASIVDFFIISPIGKVISHVGFGSCL